MHVTLLRSRACDVGYSLWRWFVGGVDGSAAAAQVIFVFGGSTSSQRNWSRPSQTWINMEILLIRHGENQANLTKEFSCKIVDYPLTVKGKVQAEQTAEALANLKIDKIVSSPLLRAKQTAEAICHRTKSKFEIDEGLREINVGDLELSPPTDKARKYFFEIINEWNSGNLEKRFAGGESGRELIERFHSVIKRYVELPVERVVLVGHAGIFLNGIAHLCVLGNDIEFYAENHHNCSISKVEVSKHSGRYFFELTDWGNTTHLYGVEKRA